MIFKLYLNLWGNSNVCNPIRETLHDRVTDLLNRAWLFWHYIALILSLPLLIASMVLFKPMQLIIARFFQYYGVGLMELSLLIFLCASFFIPQICCWMIRKRKYFLCALFLAVFVLDAVVIFAHAEYCRWSTKQVASLYRKSITVNDLYQKCHKPLAYQKCGNVTYAIYGDGSSKYMVPLPESGVIKQMPMGNLWGD